MVWKDGPPAYIHRVRPGAAQVSPLGVPGGSPPPPPTGTFLTKWGAFGFGNGQFNQPTGITVDASGDVYVTGPFNQRIQKFDANGTFLTMWGSLGTGDGQFMTPRGYPQMDWATLS